jgi:hypothetical protein
LPPSNAEVNVWRSTSTSTYVCMARYLVKCLGRL